VGCVSFQTLLDELEVSPATLKRDLEYLRSRLGAPIEYDRDAQRLPLRPRLCRAPPRTAGAVVRRSRAVFAAHRAATAGGLDSDGLLSRHLQPLLDRIQQLLGSGEGMRPPSV
jgi:hypothetical protein